MSKWFDLFKEGTHTDTAGRQHTVTAKDIRTIERKFNEAADDAPIVVGHPKDNAPAFGWLKRTRSVVANNITKLQGLADKVVPEFAEAVNRGMYKKVSVSLRPDWTIRHVGFLGAVPPAVKGLEPVLSFAADPDAMEFEFAEGELDFSQGWWVNDKIRQLGHFLQRLRDYFVETLGLEKADDILGQYTIDSIKEAPPPDKEAAEAAPGGFSEAHETPVRGKEDNKMSKDVKADTPAAAQPGEFAERVTALESENATLKKENEALKRGRLETAAREFVEKAAAAGRIPGKFVRGLVEILTDLQQAGAELNFSETEKKPSAQLLMEFLESAPVRVPTRENGAPGGEAQAEIADFAEVENVDQDRMELHKKARVLEQKEKIPYADAVRRLQKEGGK